MTVGKKKAFSGVPCYYPYLKLFVDENEPPCQSLNSLRETVEIIKDSQESFQNPSITNCSLPCKKEVRLIFQDI